MTFTKLFIGGYRELKRPVNVTNDALLRRQEEAGRRLRSSGRDVTAVLGPNAAPRRAKPNVGRRLSDTDASTVVAARLAEWPLISANASSDRWSVAPANEPNVKRASNDCR